MSGWLLLRCPTLVKKRFTTLWVPLYHAPRVPDQLAVASFLFGPPGGSLCAQRAADEPRVLHPFFFFGQEGLHALGFVVALRERFSSLLPSVSSLFSIFVFVFFLPRASTRRFLGT